jgi:uroporphyrinogen decarboxylase
MYLRALMGPEGILYAVHDDPELVHDMMKQWFSVMDTAIEKIQNIIPLDLIELAEDICYKQGLLISPDMVREFLLPYYQELVLKAKARQKIRLFLNVDTDGFADPAIPLYLEAGMNIMDPFEVASNCDVVRTGKEYPNLVMTGGIDKRILAASKEAIDKHLDYIMPAMVKRGGYIPTCDHGVPDNVSLENYLYYRKRICEMDH